LNQKYGLLVYNANRDYNVGDYIQSLAAKQFLPKVDEFVCRESLNKYQGDSLKLILNGWFMDNPNWPPSPTVEPLFVSFHLNPHIQGRLLDETGMAYFRNHGPIGCRDPSTQSTLQGHGIPAYWSSCLTTTLGDSFERKNPTTQVVFCDVLFKLPDYGEMLKSPRFAYRMMKQGELLQGRRRTATLRSLFTDSILNQSMFVTHKYSQRESHERRFQRAEELLRLYSTARLVVTSRIHCALPCLAFGTPVLFVDYGFEDHLESSRLNGIIDLMNVIYIDRHGNRHEKCNFKVPNKIDHNTEFCNPNYHLETVAKLKTTCDAFVNGK
jgi:Polysaccharide pyruvyl transferase